MFKAANPYDEIVGTSPRPGRSGLMWGGLRALTEARCGSTAKATEEKQTEVNWDTLLSVWDKVADEGETG